MKSAVRLLPWVLLLVALVFIGLDYRTTSILRSENDGLKATLQAREAAANEHDGAAQAREVELTRLRTATGQVARLQQDLRRLTAENQQLRLAPPPAAEAATPSLR